MLNITIVVVHSVTRKAHLTRECGLVVSSESTDSSFSLLGSPHIPWQPSASAAGWFLR